MISDWDTLERARRGHEDAWRELVKNHYSRLHAMALLITKSSDAADDLTQESFARLLRADLSHKDGSVSGWLGTTVWRLAIRERSRQTKLQGLDDVDWPDESKSPLANLIQSERLRVIAEAICQLSAEHRDCMVLRFYGGHSYEEIAALMEIPLGTVKSRIFNAVKNCREILHVKGVLDECI